MLQVRREKAMDGLRGGKEDDEDEGKQPLNPPATGPCLNPALVGWLGDLSEEVLLQNSTGWSEFMLG
jgi:hypothetical protein